MSRRKKKGIGDVEHHVDERWMASYMDMVTVLMCLFIVLFAMSVPDAQKYEQLKQSLATGFGQEQTENIDISEGVVVPPELEGEHEQLTDLEAAQLEVQNLQTIRDQINNSLTAQGNQDVVNYRIDERGLTVSLVGAETFFQGNSTSLSGKAIDVLNAIGPVIAPLRHEISVEGHADPHGSSGPFETDWELSSGRATQVVRYFVEHSGVAQNRAVALGYGSSRPITQDSSAAGQQQNRRVDIVIVSNQPEAIRALIPQIIQAQKDGVTLKDPEADKKKPSKDGKKDAEQAAH